MKPAKNPIRIRTWKGALRALRAGRREFCLVFGILRASHEFYIVGAKIEDWSFVDGSIIRYTRPQFQSCYGQFMKRGQLFAE